MNGVTWGLSIYSKKHGYASIDCNTEEMADKLIEILEKSGAKLDKTTAEWIIS